MLIMATPTVWDCCVQKGGSDNNIYSGWVWVGWTVVGQIRFGREDRAGARGNLRFPSPAVGQSN